MSPRPLRLRCAAGALAWAGLLAGVALGADAARSAPAATTAAASQPTAAQPALPWPAFDAQVQLAQDDPDAALAGLRALAAKGAGARPLALARGLVAAASGRAELHGQALSALAALNPDPVAAADAALLQAAWADAADDPQTAQKAARAAVDAYASACTPARACDLQPRWLALHLLSRQDRRRGLSSAALEHAMAALELARAAGDGAYQALALASAADAAGLMGDAVAEQRQLARAQSLAQADGDPLLRSRVLIAETRMHRRRGDLEATRRTAEAGIALARQGGSLRLESSHQANLSDALVALQRPREALQAVDAALPVVRRLGDRRTERVLMHNAALAHIGLRQTEAARREMGLVLAGYRQGGATADQAQALREYADAYAAAGDLPAALELFHAERRLAAEMMAANRDAALAELRKRFDHEAQQRRLEQLGLERTLVNTQLDNRAALQKVWAAGAAVVLLAAVLVALMVGRVRRLRRRLEDNQERLREQSRREPLTGLHNRRGLQETMQARGLTQAFEGALLLLDIDHFKRINDRHGHAAGDAVLVETARRVREAVGPAAGDADDDLVVRWGGEEFIVCLTGPRDNGAAAAGRAARAQELARRVLEAVGGRPYALPDGGSLRVTVSLGHACFPLEPARLPLSLERAINLVDMALYTAKNHGRNCAMGIVMTSATTPEALSALEIDFDLARSEGRVLLERLNGPPADDAPATGAPGSTREAEALRV
ncbi:GGDEF domain-containing protein [Rubrivivax rivuli]|uniref:diguanylate cyclase n=1 Tax=Rubrivivax rivuli TaxID=1862385 RepID=A0A437RR48_9BURK|nr:GGDEF domain-containing protein [Rubrivivax rivuli]RVU49270.1 GGDEF domain-containing protein [Rubrivivax rivuli]